MLSNKMEKKPNKNQQNPQNQSFRMLTFLLVGSYVCCLLAACLVGWGFFCCLNEALIVSSFVKLRAAENVSILSAGMSPIAFSVLLCTKHSAELPAAVPSAVVPVTSF